MIHRKLDQIKSVDNAIDELFKFQSDTFSFTSNPKASRFYEILL